MDKIMNRAGAPRIDAETVHAVVRSYGQRIGCDASNITAAVAWAVRHGANTMQACVLGKNRADVLRDRQGVST